MPTRELKPEYITITIINLSLKKLAEVGWESELEILQAVDAKYDHFLSTYNHRFATSFPEVQVSRKPGLKVSVKHKIDYIWNI